MSKNNNVKASLLIGIIVIACTFIIFFVGFDRNGVNTVNYLSLLFVVISELSLFSGLVYIFSYKSLMNKLIIRSGVISTLTIYWIVTIILSIVSKSIFKDNNYAFISVQIIVIAVVAIIITSLILFASKVENTNRNVNDSKLYMNTNENIVFSLKMDNKLSSYHHSLNKVYEELKYSDKVSFVVDKDRELNEKIVMLSEKLKNSESSAIDEQEFNVFIDDILLLIKERNNLLAQMKRKNF